MSPSPRRFNRENATFIQRLLSPLSVFRELISDAVFGDDGIRTGERNPFVAAITFPIRFLWAFLVFMVQAWTTSRSGIAFIKGLPAMGCLAMAPALAYLFTAYDRPVSLVPAVVNHGKFLESGDNKPAVEMFARKMVDVRPNEPQFKFTLGEALAANGRVGEAVRLMELLAEGQTPGQFRGGMSAAHFWLSQYYQNQMVSEGLDDERFAKAEDHLESAVAIDGENVRAKLSLATLHLSRTQAAAKANDPRVEEYKTQAIESLRELITGNFVSLAQVNAVPELIKLLVDSGQMEEAQTVLDQGVAKISTIARSRPDMYELWYAVIRSNVMLRNYAKANEFIVESFKSVQSDESRKSIAGLASQVHIQNADDYANPTDEESYRQRLFALCRAVQVNPRDAQIYARLLEYVHGEEEGGPQDEWLDNAIIGCPIPGMVHILIGIREVRRGNVVRGQKHWEISQFQFPSSELVAHRLIAIAAQSNSGVSNSGELISLAIEMFPGQTLLYETRAKLLMSENRYDDAIADLEIMIDKMPNLLSVRQLLANAYKKTGRGDEAEVQLEEIENLLNQVGSEKAAKFREALNEL